MLQPTDDTGTAPSRRFASTQINIPDPHRSDLLAFAQSIPDEELDGEGRESNPHVTVKYGLHDDSPDTVRDVASATESPTFTLGKLGVFPATPARNSDVLHVRVNSPDLHRLNKQIGKASEHTDTHPTYTPHVTLAYLKPGEGKKYKGATEFSGRKIRADSLVHSSTNDCVTHCPFKGAKDIAPLSTADDGVWLHFEGAFFELSAASDKPPIVGYSLGQPIYETWSDALIDGNYTHPKTDQKFSITPDIRATSAQSLGQMLSAGIDVPIVEDHQEKAGKSLGWVKGAKIDGDRLRLKHHFIGDDALLKASRNKVSVKILPYIKDSKGQVYKHAITHSSLTPLPVIPNQTGFSVAASRSAAADLADVSSAPVFTLAAPISPRSLDMEKLSKEQIDRLRKLPGAADTTDDEATADFLLSYAEQCGTNLAAIAEEKATLLSRAETAEAKVLELSAAAPGESTPDDATLMLLSRAAETEWSNVTAAGYPAALTKDLKALFRDGGKPNALALSRAHGCADPLEFAVTGLLAKHGAAMKKITGTVTGDQNALHLSQQDDSSKDADDAQEMSKLKKKMIYMANGKCLSTASMAKMTDKKPKKKDDDLLEGD